MLSDRSSILLASTIFRPKTLDFQGFNLFFEEKNTNIFKEKIREPTA